MTGLLLLSAFGYPYMRQGFFPTWFTTSFIWNTNCRKGNNYTRVVQDLKEIETYLKGRRK